MHVDATPLSEHHARIRELSLTGALDFAAQNWGERLCLEEIEHLGRRLTWAQFHERVHRLRSGLESAGLAPGDKVGVLIGNQIEFPIVWFAVVSAGAAIVPLNVKYTSREVDFVLRDADAAWLIGTADLLASHVGHLAIPGLTAERVVSIGEGPTGSLRYERLLEHEVTAPAHRPTQDDLSNIQFTSGTTGLPKGCLLTHEYWIELGVMGASAYRDPTRFLADHPFYYMQNQAYFAMALACGAAVFIAPGLSRRRFLGWLHDYRIDFAWVDEDMLELPPSERDAELSLPVAPVAGMPSAAYPLMQERFGIQGRESYASTELGTAIGVPYDRPDLAGNGSMGICVPNRESKVIDENLVEVPPGTPGELCVRGKGIMIGYHDRPEANAELLLDGGWFRTGDVVVKTEDGLHYFVGRLKDMIRRSGENISALEVETQLYELDGVEEVAAIAVPDAEREEEVKVIIVRSDESLTAEKVVSWAAKTLAPFKVPRYVEFRDALPYTGSGKIAKGELKSEPPFHDAVFDTRRPAAG